MKYKYLKDVVLLILSSKKILKNNNYYYYLTSRIFGLLSGVPALLHVDIQMHSNSVDFLSFCSG